MIIDDKHILLQRKQKNIDFQYAGLTEDQTQHLRTIFEIDDGIARSGVEFLAEDWEYEFEIETLSGKIISFAKEHKYDERNCLYLH